MVTQSASGPVQQVEERMARYATEHKEATSRCIVETAGRRLKGDGIDGSGIATLMADAGVPTGAFYAHGAGRSAPAGSALAPESGSRCRPTGRAASPARPWFRVWCRTSPQPCTVSTAWTMAAQMLA